MNKVDRKLECLRLAVVATSSREPKTVSVFELAQRYYDWVTSAYKYEEKK